MKSARKRFDFITKTITYIASSFSVIILLLILGFIFSRGSSALSWDMLTGNYWSTNYLVGFQQHPEPTYEYTPKEGEYFSEKFGFALTDSVNQDQVNEVVLSYIAPDSLLTHSYDLSLKTEPKTAIDIQLDGVFERVEYVDEQGNIQTTGSQYKHDAKTVMSHLNEATQINSVFYKSQGGGIWGSLTATLLLIVLSLAFALPLGIFAAIYLNEVASSVRTKNIISSFIEMLAGVPSIIFGLVGVVALYPVTSIFGIDGLSILLGALTMTIVLLPVIIRSVQESLMVVPVDYRYASLSLGATKTQTIFKVILPSALPGIISAMILSISRIIGESAALIYTMGTFVNDSPTISAGGTSLAVHIWSIMSGEQPNFRLASAISIVIIVIILILNILVKLTASRLNRKFGG